MRGDADVDDVIERLERARSEKRSLRNELEVSPDRARALEEPLRRAQGLLDGYEDSATGTGDFSAYLEFRSSFDDLVDGLDDDLPHRSAFEAAGDALDHRRLADRHFEEARAALEPVRETVETLQALREVEDDLGRIRRTLQDRRDDLEVRREHLERLSRLDPSALEAPVEALRDPIERYNEAIVEDFDRYLGDRPAGEVLTTLDRLDHFALLDVEPPPQPLLEFLGDHSTGDEPLPRLLEYLEFSRSKLDHYVAEPGRFLSEVRPHAPYLERLSADPFQIDWPPPDGDTMRWFTRELRQAANRFARETTVATLREIESLVRDENRYETLRTAAVAQVDLAASDRDLVRRGAVEDDLETVERRLERIDAKLNG